MTAPLTTADARDLFLLWSTIPQLDSLKATMLVYDRTVADLGQPGIGYDPVVLRGTVQGHASLVHCELGTALALGLDHARAEGWL